MGKRLLAVATAAALLAPSVQPAPAGAAPANGATGDASSNRRVEPNAKKAPAMAAEARRSLTPPRRPPMTRRGPMTSPRLRRPRPTGPMTTPWPRVARPKRRFSARTSLRTRQSRPTMPLSGPTNRRRPRSTRQRRKPRAELAAAQVALDAAQRDARGPSGQEGRRRAVEQGSVRLLCLDRRPAGRGHPEERAVRCRDAPGRGERCLAHRQRPLRVPVH